MRVEIIDNIFLRRFGSADAPKLICLHGFADSSHMYAPLSETVLIDRFEVIAVDLPGFGASPRDPSINLIQDFARTITALAAVISPGEPVGLIGHSIASAIAVDMVPELALVPIGLLSIEGNLTEADAYFSGMAADWNSPNSFKEAFCNEIWDASEKNRDLRRYFGGVVLADATAMWHLGNDARRVSAGDAVGKAYMSVNVPTLYYWGAATTPNRTREFIEKNSLSNHQYTIESHWPTVASPIATAEVINEFFGNAL